VPRKFTSLPPAGADAFGAWYDDAAADAAVEFIEKYIRLTEGEWTGEPFMLADWQKDRIIRPLFGWKRADGTRLFRDLYVEVPRKNGKTELAAAIALLLLVADGEMVAQGYCMAVNEAQAKILFNKAARMVGLAPPALAQELVGYKDSIYCPGLQARLAPLSAKPTGKQGFNPHFGICDETHEWLSGDLAQAMEEGMGARRQPLMVYITTAGVFGEGYGWELHDRACRVVDGEIDDPTMLVAIWGLEDGEDWRDPDAWAAANPNYGVSVKPDFLAAQAAKAEESPRQELRFRRYSLNDWTESDHRFFNMEYWDACGGRDGFAWRDELPRILAGRECWGGLDLSSTTDTTAWCLAFPPPSRLEPWFMLWRFFLPEGLRSADIVERERRDRAPYRQWRDDGAMTFTPGNVVDYDVLYDQIIEDSKTFNIRQIAHDRWNSVGLVTRLADDGVDMVGFGQGFASMTGPTKKLEEIVLAGKLNHGAHPVARRHARDTAVEEDAAENMKPTKAKATGRIDGTVAAIMAVGVGEAGEGGDVSFWEAA